MRQAQDGRPVRSRGRTAVIAAVAGALALATPGLAATAAEEYERIINGTFENGETSPWWAGNESTTMSVAGGELCVEVTGGTENPWSALIGQSRVPLEKGGSYTLSFDAHASAPVTIGTTVQLGEEPYTTTLNKKPELTEKTKHFSYDFTSSLGSDAGQVTFQLGGHAKDFTLCVDNVSLVGGSTPPGGGGPETGPAVRVNQVGYLPQGPKVATVVSEATSPVPWELRTSEGKVVANGDTTVYGDDAASGQHVHQVDFSNVTRTGRAYVLAVDGEESYPFDITSDVYDKLRYDALTFFYHQRSGVPIKAEYVGEQYARPAGHVGKAPNQGDISVPCDPDPAYQCDYELDVSGGWYDAGDHGKYVVAGGYAAWTLLNQYERAVHVEGADAGALADGTLPLPEAGNGVPDILDEARWELEFLMSMQIPQGEKNAGMAHHKIHDDQWTGLPMLPHKDPRPRYLQPPSTAATLNLAATAAQCARIYDEFDQQFADRCRAAAERAWKAAQAHPDMIASPDNGTGGGAYSDSNVTDEFYWATAELFITTGKDTYLQAFRSNPRADMPADELFSQAGFSWGYVAPLAHLSLATVPNEMPDAQLTNIEQSIITGADGYIDDLGSQGYPVPYAPTDGAYVWGSNGQVLANGMVIATAYDLTGDEAYAQAAVTTLGYILGRNALNQSYVTGYGEKASKNQHHRFWAHQLDSSLPHPPAGSLAGGPDSGLDDPVAQRELQGCVSAPQTCYIDHIESYSTNEVTIYWNAPLAWLAAFAAEQSGGV